MPRSAVRCVLRGTNTQAVPLGWVAAVGACRCLSVPAVCCGALLTTLLLPPALLPCAACRSGCAGCVGPAKCLCGCEMDGGTIHECAVWGTRPSHGCCSGSRGQRNAVGCRGMQVGWMAGATREWAGPGPLLDILGQSRSRNWRIPPLGTCWRCASADPRRQIRPNRDSPPTTQTTEQPAEGNF